MPSPLPFRILCALSAVVWVANAHTYLDSIIIGGVAQPSGDCVRPHPPQAKENPISLVSSSDMTCGFLPYSAQPANRKCPVAAGSSVSLQWWHTQPGDDVVQDTHKGPCLVYLAKSDTGAGPVWFKIFESGLDVATQTWCVDTLIANRGVLPFTIPADIAPGNYLLRGEIFALHNAGTLDGVQPYVGCIELTISGSGTANPSGVAFPGYYKDTDPGLYPVSLYNGPLSSYVIPGPPVYKAGSGGGGSSTPTTPTQSSTTGSASTPTTPTTPTNPTTATQATTASASSSGTPATTTATCGSVTVTKTFRVAANEPVGHNIFDLTVKNTGSTISPNTLKITITASNGNFDQSWNLQSAGSNQYTFSETINSGQTYTGAGFIIQGTTAAANADVTIVCASTGSSSTVTTPSTSSSATTGASTPAVPSTTGSTPAASTTGSSNSGDAGECANLNSVFAADMSGRQCWGLSRAWGPMSADDCAKAACNAWVDVWQWCQAGSSCSPASSCWIGKSDNCDKTASNNGWVSRAVKDPNASAGSSSTTGSSTPSNPTTPSSTTGSATLSSTTGSSNTGSAGCSAGISFALGQVWNNGGMVAVTISNTGTKAITYITVQLDGNIQTWNLLASSHGIAANHYNLPAWALPINPGAKFTSGGYTFTGAQPNSGSIVDITC